MVAVPLLPPSLLKYVSDRKGNVEGERGVSFDKDRGNDIQSIDKTSKNSEDVPPIVYPSADPTTHPFVQPTAHSSAPPLNDHVLSPAAHVSSPTAHVSSLIAGVTSPHTAPVSSPTIHVASPSIHHTAPTVPSTAAPTAHVLPITDVFLQVKRETYRAKSVVVSDVELIDGGVDIGSDVDGYMDEEL
ncbi:hypothetical protein FXO38_08757 [Capsicum annuum]|nr:hypothetical protein FXO38_08757 [Capsicum annuum]KAF3672460.1 hypothetical protein FXO37_07511 [Capsicum annuum]